MSDAVQRLMTMRGSLLDKIAEAIRSDDAWARSNGIGQLRAEIERIDVMVLKLEGKDNG